ncbi:MAG TPA: Hpt domain-containing protein, partial [Acetobacteraceae bacterium]
MNHPRFAMQLMEDLEPDDLRLILSVFQSDVARLTGVLRLTAKAGDDTGFRRAAHGLAGASGAVGADALERACRAAMARPGMAPADLAAALGEIEGLAAIALAD